MTYFFVSPTLLFTTPLLSEPRSQKACLPFSHLVHALNAYGALGSALPQLVEFSRIFLTGTVSRAFRGKNHHVQDDSTRTRTRNVSRAEMLYRSYRFDHWGAGSVYSIFANYYVHFKATTISQTFHIATAKTICPSLTPKIPVRYSMLVITVDSNLNLHQVIRNWRLTWPAKDNNPDY